VTRRGQRGRAIASLAAGVVALAAAGCGTSERHANRNRPPLPINLAVYVSGSSVSVSPAKLGAGPVVLVATNQTDQPHSLTLVEDRDGARRTVTRSTAPIVPRGTASLPVNVVEGRYELRADDDAIAPARIAVGAARASSQNTLELP